jgi:hypothetical protein
MDSDPKCASQHTEPVLSQAMVVNDKGQMQWVFVRVKSGLSGTFPAPATPAVLDQHGCMYVPHVMGVMVNQPVAILNSDATLHNVNVKPTANKGFNMGMPVKGMKIEQKFSKPELGIPFKCDVHPWMGATLHVVDNPFFAVSDVEGRFEIKGLPPGTYTLEAVHESAKVPARTFQVTVKADTSVRADVALAAQ